MNRPVDPDILDGFLAEAFGYLPPIRDGLAHFRQDPADTARLEEAHRCLHTIKGAASMVGITGLSHIAYQVEEAVLELMHGHLPPEPATFAGVELGVTAVEVYLEGMRDGTLQEDSLVRETVKGLRELRGLPATDDTSPDADSLPEMNLDALDTALDLPALSDADTVSDGEVPVPDFAALPAMPELVPPPPAKPVVNDIAPELLEVFRLEAEDHLRVLTTILPAARKGPVANDQWHEVRRAAHTLKGAAAMVGFADVTTLAHRMEDLLDLYAEGGRTPTPDETELLLLATDGIDDAIAGRPAELAVLIAKFDALRLTIPAEAEVETAPDVVPEPAETEPEVAPTRRGGNESYVRVPIEKLNDIVKLVGELVISRTAFEQRMGDFHRLLNELEPSTLRLRRASGKLDAQFEASALAGGRLAVAGKEVSALRGDSFHDGDEFDDLEFDRYTEFHLISRELAETTTDIQTLGGELGYLQGDFEGHLTRQARLGSEIEDKLMRLRMVPLGTISTKLHRTVRNAARQTGKPVELAVVGERTGLDKAVLEAMNDPLLHLLRNAVDHGLETAAERRAAGKPETGAVTLTAGHEGSQVVLTVADDGRGIDPERVRAAVIDRGLLAADDARTLSQSDLFAYLFVPGFSTKGEVSELSGRGVGLDVVKTKVEALKGTVQVASAPGRGTTFVIRLPMTLAVVRTLLVQSEGQTFAVPLEAVEQIVRLDESDIQRVGLDPAIKVGERVYTLAPLSRLLNLKEHGGEPVARPPVLLVKAGERRLAVVVDRLIGGREVVVKNLGSHLKRVPGVSGATLMGDGSVVLILNPAEFVRRTAPLPVSVKPVAPAATPTDSAKAALTVLVVDDSPSVRRVLTTLVERNGWTAVTAKDGLEALETLQRGQVRPDVVLTDIEMPRMDGYELLSTVRAQPTSRDLPVVMITSRSAEKHRKRALSLGASGYVTKPYQDEALTTLIRQLARR